MENSLQKELEKSLMSIEKYTIEDRLNKNLVSQLAREYDQDLLNLIQQKDVMKKHFFTNTEIGYIFKKDYFIQFINNRELFPNNYTMYKKKIGLGIDENNYLSENQTTILNWQFKDCTFEGGQTKENSKRKELFFNDILSPDEINRLTDIKVLTNFYRVDKDKEEYANELKREDNIIIKGNNLIGLHCLKHRLDSQQEKIKLIYLDPPYNTGSDSFGYNDSFPHSTWLTFMKNRLEIAKTMLAEDGFIVIQTDDSEQAYMKVLMDEIFGRGNYINTVSVLFKNVAGASGGGEDKRLKKNVEYLTIYSKNYEISKPFKSVVSKKDLFELLEEYRKEKKSWKYNNILMNEGQKVYVGSTLDGHGDEIKIYRHDNYELPSIKQVMENERLTEQEVYKKYIDKIYRGTMPQSSIRTRVMEKYNELTNLDPGLISIEYVPKSGKNKGINYKQFYSGNKFNLFAWLSDVVVTEEDGSIFKTEKLGTFWDFVGETKNVNKEGSVQLSNGKKPEKLLQTIIEMTTKENEIILDFFMGTASTQATALKLGRRFYGMEQIEEQWAKSIKRLTNVVKGDSTGISKEVGWSNGGSFVYCEIKEDAQEFLERVNRAEEESELLQLFEEARKSSFLSYRVNPQSLNKNSFKAISIGDQKKILRDLVDKNYLYLNYSEINDEVYNINEIDKKLNMAFYGGE